jgi:lipopolysaccharide transport system ATP-binding protein
MSEIAIQVEKLSKRYRIGMQEERPRNLTQAIAGWVQAPFRNFRRVRGLTYFGENGHEAGSEVEDIIWALQDVSFEVMQGDTVGVIGRNGAGKSTLLKILSRITGPTSGRAVINGRVASLLEVGTGFHPELTGRENVYLNATILGMRKSEVDRKFDEILAFSGVEKFIDTPVKFYSSGMKVRLAFSVAAHLEPEILIIDEVLAVGDAEFQKKCLGKMGEVATQGRTVLFVSHHMAAIENLCHSAMLLDGGRLLEAGETSEIIRRYVKLIDEHKSKQALAETALDRSGSGQAIFERVEFLSPLGENVNGVPVGKDATVELYIHAFDELEEVEVAVGLFTAHGLRLSGYNSRELHNMTFKLQRDATVVVRFMLQRLTLAPGLYKLNLLLRDRHRQLLDKVDDAITFEVIASDFFGSGRLPSGSNLVFFESSWVSSEIPVAQSPVSILA